MEEGPRGLSSEWLWPAVFAGWSVSCSARLCGAPSQGLGVGVEREEDALNTEMSDRWTVGPLTYM